MAAREVDIALWGPSSSGKTMLLAQLYDAWPSGTGWHVRASEEGISFVEAARAMIRAHRFPLATLPDKAEKIEYHFQHIGSDRMVRLLLQDWAGARYEQRDQEALHRLGDAQGVVVLLDPARHPTAFSIALEHTLETLHVRSRRMSADPRPIAICVSKADRLIEDAAQLNVMLEEPDRFVREWLVKEHGQRGLVDRIEAFCSNYRFFPVSSVGVQERYGTIESVVFCDEQLVDRIGPRVKPFNLAAPFLWMFDELAGGAS